ncbi:MAG: VanZ family protein [Planctomycetota bacterium]|jgi:VanZ family protein
MPELRESRLLWFFLAAFALLLIYSSLMPYDLQWQGDLARQDLQRGLGLGPMRRQAASALDVVSNVLAYMPLGLLTALAWQAHRRRGRVGAVVVAGIVGLVISLAVETLQLLSPSRVADVLDVAMNVLGAAVGGLIGAAVGGGWWVRAQARLQRWAVDRPAALAAAILAILLVADATFPWRPTLDVSEVWRNIKASVVSISDGLAAHPWHHWIARKLGVYAALSALLAAGLSRGAARRLRAVGLTILFAAAIEGMKIGFTGRVFNLANILTAATGAVVGGVLSALLAGLRPVDQLRLAGRAVLCYAAYAAWQPFLLEPTGSAMAAKVPTGAKWLPLYHYAMGGRPADVRNAAAWLILAAAWMFVARLASRKAWPDASPRGLVSAAVSAGVIGLMLEAGQFMISGRTPSTTDVAIFAIGGLLGAHLAAKYEALAAEATIEETH